MWVLGVVACGSGGVYLGIWLPLLDLKIALFRCGSELGGRRVTADFPPIVRIGSFPFPPVSALVAQGILRGTGMGRYRIGAGKAALVA